MSELPRLSIIDESALAGISARQARNITFVGVPLAGALLGTLLALAIIVSGAKPSAGFAVGGLRAEPTGYVLGMVLGLVFSVITPLSTAESPH